VPVAIAQIWSLGSVPSIAYWHLDASTDWSFLSTIKSGNLSKLFVTVEMSDYNFQTQNTNDEAQVQSFITQFGQINSHGNTTVVGITVNEWADVHTRPIVALASASAIFPDGVANLRFDGITDQVFAQGRDCVRPRYAYSEVSAMYKGVGWYSGDLVCYPIIRLLPLPFLIAPVALGVIALAIYTISTCCLVRAQTKNAHVRYIPLAPDSRTDPHMVAIQTNLDALLDAVLSGYLNTSLELLAAQTLNHINLVQASLLKMVTNRRTKDAVEMRCETLRKRISTLQIYARLALASRPGDIEEDERLQTQAAEEVQLAQRNVRRVIAQMREELAELERLRDSDVRVEYGLSLRIFNPKETAERPWRVVRTVASGSPKPLRKQSKTSLNV